MLGNQHKTLRKRGIELERALGGTHEHVVKNWLVSCYIALHSKHKNHKKFTKIPVSKQSSLATDFASGEKNTKKSQESKMIVMHKATLASTRWEANCLRGSPSITSLVAKLWHTYEMRDSIISQGLRESIIFWGHMRNPTFTRGS